MLNAGKHVLCEKPLADTLKDVKLVHKVAQEKQLFFMEVCRINKNVALIIYTVCGWP